MSEVVKVVREKLRAKAKHKIACSQKPVLRPIEWKPSHLVVDGGRNDGDLLKLRFTDHSTAMEGLEEGGSPESCPIPAQQLEVGCRALEIPNPRGLMRTPREVGLICGPLMIFERTKELGN